jgi:hypothetical protein
MRSPFFSIIHCTMPYCTTSPHAICYNQEERANPKADSILIMGCGGSKGSAAPRNNKAEADRHARRKKNNFRDSGLERTRKACVQQKKLHHVEDPAKHKKEKIAKIKKEQKKKPTGPVGMTENELQKKRANLNHH